MMSGKRSILFVFYLILGITLFTCSVTGVLDEFWGGMGVAFAGVGIAQLVRQIRYRTNEEYREKWDVGVKDERNKFLANKAWAWAGYCFVILNGIAVIPLKLLGYEDLMMTAAYSVCTIILFYWIAHMILRRKY